MGLKRLVKTFYNTATLRNKSFHPEISPHPVLGKPNFGLQHAKWGHRPVGGELLPDFPVDHCKNQ